MADTQNDIYRRILEETPEAMIWADRGGRIRFWNHAAEEVFGFTAAETIGQRMDMIIPENLRARHWEGYDRVMVAGQPSRYGRREMLKVPAMRKDGTRVSVEFTLHALEHPEFGLIAVAVLRDASETFAELRDLRKRLAEAEARAGDALVGR
ncbi:MAG: PAS domain S-box protein [Dehalococcoidia bacterium]|nr:MAG: PAS domain S-box protein [Dehalococcoidia bacterium]